MKKTLIAIIAIALIVVTAFALVSCTGNADIKNASFDEFSSDNKFSVEELLGWKYSEGDNTATRKAEFPLIAQGSDESKELVTNRYLNMEITSSRSFINFTQKVKLKAKQSYALSFSINIPSTISVQSNGYGAFVGFDEDINFKFANYTSSTSGWERKTVYFDTDASGTYTLIVGLGRNGTAGALGKVQFDNIKIEALDEFPIEGLTGTLSGETGSAKGGILAYVIIMLLVTIILLIGAYLLHLRYKYKHEFGIAEKSKWLSPFMTFLYVMSGVFIIRFLILALTGGMSSEMTELGDVAFKLHDKGMNNIFATSNTTLPTGMLYWLSLVGAVGNAAELSSLSIGTSILIRLPNVLADIIACYVLFLIVSKYRSDREGVVAAAIYGLLPTFFSFTALWGQNTSIALAFMIGMMYFMIEKKYIGVSGMFLGAMLFNNYAIILAPIVILYDIYYLIKDKSSMARLSIPLGAVAVVVLIFLLSLPFTINYVSDGNVFIVFKKILAEFTGNVAVSNSAFGLYGMFGLGGAVSTLASKIITGIIMVIFLGLGAWGYLMHRNRLDLILLSALSMILYSVFGIGARIEMMVIGIVLLMLYAFLREDRRVFGAFNIYAVLSFINIGAVLVSSNVFYNTNVYSALAGNNWLYILGSILTVFNTIYLLVVSYFILFKDRLQYVTPIENYKSYFITLKDNAKRLFSK